MKSMKRRISVIAALALVAGVLSLGASVSPASAGTATNVNACDNSATFAFSEIPVTFSGTSSPNPSTLGVDTISLTGATYGVAFDATLLLAGYNLGLLVPGENIIPAEGDITVNASNTAEGSVTFTGITFTATTTITDNAPAGPGPEDTATPLEVNVALPDSTWTPTGGDIEFTDGGSAIDALLGGGFLTVSFNCQGVSAGLTPAGCDAEGSTVDCTGFIPGPATPFEVNTVIAPPAPPVCSNGSFSVGGTQSIPIDIGALCSDQNGDLDLGSGAILTPPVGGTLSAIDASGVTTYTNVDAGVGTDSFTFTFADSGGNGASNEATVTISVLGNLCDATAGPCDLTQVVTFDVTGTTLTMEQTGQFLTLSEVTLNGQPQIASGSLNDVTVLNARGDAAGFTVSAYSTDYGTPGAPTTDPDANTCVDPGPLTNPNSPDGCGNAPDGVDESADDLVAAGGEIICIDPAPGGNGVPAGDLNVGTDPADPAQDDPLNDGLDGRFDLAGCGTDVDGDGIIEADDDVIVIAAPGQCLDAGAEEDGDFATDNCGDLADAVDESIDDVFADGPLPAVYDCSFDSGLIGGAGAADRLCIPGNNMGWSPTAGVAHDVIPGDVAEVNPGPASAADAAAWLAELVSVGVVDDPSGGLGQGGLVGYTGAISGGSELCTAPLDRSGGTFSCDAELWLGVPASAGAGAYNGAIILTLA